ncbi:MAG: Trm112 family protein [Actinomycetia bacterium]|nr:Trm112 family protein [Actinomycetes bacterium]
MPPELLAILACPACHSALQTVPDDGPPQFLVCTGQECRLRYPVRDGIPILLVDEATRAN